MRRVGHENLADNLSISQIGASPAVGVGLWLRAGLARAVPLRFNRKWRSPLGRVGARQSVGGANLPCGAEQGWERVVGDTAEGEERQQGDRIGARRFDTRIGEMRTGEKRKFEKRRGAARSAPAGIALADPAGDRPPALGETRHRGKPASKARSAALPEAGPVTGPDTEMNAGRYSTGRIVVRSVEPKDREAVRAQHTKLGKAQHARTIFADIPFSDAKYDRRFGALYANRKHMVGLVAQLRDKIVGAIAATAGEFYIGEGHIVATVNLIAIDKANLSPALRAKTFLRLLKGIRVWAETRKAKRILVHVTTGRDLKATDKLLRAAGMQGVGGGYVG